MWCDGVFGESVFQRSGKNAVYSVVSDFGKNNRRFSQIDAEIRNSKNEIQVDKREFRITKHETSSGKFEARNPKYETISNDKMSNVQNYRIE